MRERFKIYKLGLNNEETTVDIVYKEYILTADEFILFADKMGETDGMTKEQAEKSLANHRCCIAAFICDELLT